MDDLQWIEEESKVNQIEDFTLVPETMMSIPVHYIYINLNSEVEDKVVQMVHLDISGNDSVLSKESILYLIQNHKMYTPTTQYKFMSAVLYHVNILAAHLQSFIKEDVGKLISSPFLKECFIVNDIVIKPSLPIFHSTNSIYFFFKEELLKKTMVKNNIKMAKTIRVRPSLEKGHEVDEVEKEKKSVEEVDFPEPPSLDNQDTKSKGKTKRVRILDDFSSLNKSKKRRIIH